MDDERGRFLGMSHGTTPATVTTNKIKKLVPLGAVKTFKSKSGPDISVSDNQSSSVTLKELAMKARKSYCNFKFQQRSHTMTMRFK